MYVPLCFTENVYAEPRELYQSYGTIKDGAESPDLGCRFPSKRGRDINKEWASYRKQLVPLPPKPGEESAHNVASENQELENDKYLSPESENPPPSYEQALDEIIPAPTDSPLSKSPVSEAPPSANHDSYYFTPLSDEEAEFLQNLPSPNQRINSPDLFLPNPAFQVQNPEYLAPVDSSQNHDSSQKHDPSKNHAGRQELEIRKSSSSEETEEDTKDLLPDLPVYPAPIPHNENTKTSRH